MSIRALTASFVLTPLAAVAIVAIAACGGSGNGASLFDGTQPDSGPIVAPYDGGSLLPGPDANADAAVACTPAVLGTSFKAVWKPPTTAAAAKCDPTQTEGYWDNCLAASVTSSQCTTFIAANADCASCLQSDDTDAAYGAVIWHSNRAFYTLNTAGCIANELNDVTATSCGAAYQAAVQCEETACSVCGVADYALFPACEKAASSECTEYLTALGTVCGDGLRDASDPASVCTSANNTQDAYLAIAPVFCGPGT